MKKYCLHKIYNLDIRANTRPRNVHYVIGQAINYYNTKGTVFMQCL